MTNKKRITIKEVAKIAEVSTATVSRVLNGTGQVSDDTVAKVQMVVQQLNYQPNHAAHLLASNRTRTIGVLIDELGGEYSLPLLRGIQVASNQAGYEFLIYPTKYRTQKHYPVNETNTDGLIILANSLSLNEIERLVQQDFPIILLAQTSPSHLQIPYVTVENENGAYLMMKHLITRCGYRHFAFLEGELGHEDNVLRKKGYSQALRQWGLKYEDQLIGQGEFSEEIAFKTVKSWMEEQKQAQVIVAYDDDSAIGAIAALREAEKQIPDEIAVVGFDDIRLSQYFDPPLTTIRVPIEAAARASVNQLVQLIESEEAVIKATTLPVELIIRKSCGAYSQKLGIN